MKTNLQTMRKRAGFRSAKAFADHIGMSVNTYTNYEQGVSAISLEKAWEFADELNCTLDEIAGREAPKMAYADKRQATVNESFEAMNDHGRDALTTVAKSMRKDVENRVIEKDRAEHPSHKAAMGA